MPNLNIQDAAAQEKIRRGSHEYTMVDGHQTYVPKIHLHQEYPKFMDTTPAPRIAEFKGKGDAQALLDQAMRDWEQKVMASVVHSKSQETEWLKKNERRAS